MVYCCEVYSASLLNPIQTIQSLSRGCLGCEMNDTMRQIFHQAPSKTEQRLRKSHLSLAGALLEFSLGQVLSDWDTMDTGWVPNRKPLQIFLLITDIVMLLK